MAASGTARGALIIAGVAAGAVAAFAWAAGFLTPGRLAPERSVAALQPPGGAAAGARRNHADVALYAAMVSMPLIGWAMVSAAGLPMVM